VTIAPDASLRQAAALMEQHRISCLVAADGRVPLGILTERDVARHVDRLGEAAADYLVRDIMSSRVVTIDSGSDLYTAYSLMSGKGIRHLVVTGSDGMVEGVMTFTDLMSRLGNEFLAELKTVAEVMTQDVLTQPASARIRDALHAMIARNVSCVLMVNGGRAEGILTERDVTRIMVKDPAAGERLVEEVMSRPVLTVSPERYAFEAVERMEESGVRHLAVADADGHLVGVVSQTDMVAALIERYASLEFMVRKRTRQLVRKNEELEYSNQQLRHVDEIKSAFLTSVSHELRTPLTSLIGFTKLTRRSFLEHFSPLAGEEGKLRKVADQIASNLAVVHAESERMTRLINDFLDLTKIEAGRMEWRDRLVSATDFILHACHAVRGQVEKKPGLELAVNVSENLPLLYVDMDRMLQVMINLLNNAIKFTETGRITVRAECLDAQFVVISVADTGPGIAEPELVKVFDKYHQLEKRDHCGSMEGTGLGLAICKEIVEHYSGSIWATSAPGQGCVFTVRLPAAKPAPDQELDLVARDMAEDGGEGPLVLAVDDNPGIREYLQQLLTGEGFRVVTATDGASALDAARKFGPHCILMDLMMPGMDGGEAIRRLRQDPATKDIPVAVLSAYPNRGAAGGDVALPKPVDEGLLVQTVQGLVRGGRISGRKCILVPNPKESANLLMISAGKLMYVRPDELRRHFLNKFSGTVYVSGDAKDTTGLIKLSNLDDVLVVILPEDDKN
jgi:signal transduction histidine kinase